MLISRLCVIGYIGPATAPCSARNSISMPMLSDTPHMNDVSENSRVHATNSFTSPKRRLRKPVSGSEIAMLTANEVITQVLWSLLTPRLPAIVGSDTLAMVVSSTCMNVASDRPNVLSARLGGRNWAVIEFCRWEGLPWKRPSRCPAWRIAQRMARDVASRLGDALAGLFLAQPCWRG